jgi:hypothetical protein
VSNFDQNTSADECMRGWGRRAQHESAMSKTEEFWEFAREATLLACNAEADEDKRGLFYLARTWTQAALLERATVSDRSSDGKLSAA